MLTTWAMIFNVSATLPNLGRSVPRSAAPMRDASTGPGYHKTMLEKMKDKLAASKPLTRARQAWLVLCQAARLVELVKKLMLTWLAMILVLWKMCPHGSNVLIFANNRVIVPSGLGFQTATSTLIFITSATSRMETLGRRRVQDLFQAAQNVETVSIICCFCEETFYTLSTQGHHQSPPPPPQS